MLRTLLVFAVIVPGVIAGFASRHAALLLYLWFALFRPQEYSWVDLGALKLSLILGALLVVPALLTRVFPNLSHPLSWGSLGFLLLACVAHLNATSAAISWQWIDFLARLLLICLLSVTINDTPRRIWLTVTVVAGSFGFHTAQAGLYSLMRGGSRFAEGLGGAFIDNNGYALGAAMTIPLLIIAAQNAPSKWLRLGLFAAVPLTAFTVVSTFSRGGFLALGAVAMVYLLVSKRKAAAVLVLSAAALAVPFLPLPEGYTERLGTIQTYEQEKEESAVSRIHFWRVAVVIAAANPFGVGLFNFEQVYDQYDFRDGAHGRGRSVHSSHFQVLAELGWPGLVAWILLFACAFRVAFRLRRRARDPSLTPDAQRLFLTLGNGLAASMAAFLVGGAFIALALNDLTWLTFALLASGDRVSEQLSLEQPASQQADALTPSPA